jgi:hypothetical protein
VTKYHLIMAPSLPKPADAKITHAETAPKLPEGARTQPPAAAKETGGPAGLEPTRYGDWEHKGRCIDF